MQRRSRAAAIISGPHSLQSKLWSCVQLCELFSPKLEDSNLQAPTWDCKARRKKLFANLASCEFPRARTEIGLKLEPSPSPLWYHYHRARRGSCCNSCNRCNRRSHRAGPLFFAPIPRQRFKLPSRQLSYLHLQSARQSWSQPRLSAASSLGFLTAGTTVNSSRKAARCLALFVACG